MQPIGDRRSLGAVTWCTWFLLTCALLMVSSHAKVEALFNPSPYGLTVVTTAGVPPKPPPPPPATPLGCAPLVNALKYDSVWMGGAPDWAALQVALGSDGAGMDVAMEMAQRELDHYRTGLRDQWNVHGLYANDGYGLDGQPWCTAHYGFHMPLWFIPYAMTGQLYSAVDQSLSFAPKVPCSYRLPLLSTGAVGTLTCSDAGNAGLVTTLAPFPPSKCLLEKRCPASVCLLTCAQQSRHRFQVEGRTDLYIERDGRQLDVKVVVCERGRLPSVEADSASYA